MMESAREVRISVLLPGATVAGVARVEISDVDALTLSRAEIWARYLLPCYLAATHEAEHAQPTKRTPVSDI